MESSHASGISCIEHQSWPGAQTPQSWEGQVGLVVSNSPGLEGLEVVEVRVVEAMEVREIL